MTPTGEIGIGVVVDHYAVFVPQRDDRNRRLKDEEIVVLRLCGQMPIGPSDVLAQLKAPIRRAISPLCERKAVSTVEWFIIWLSAAIGTQLPSYMTTITSDSLFDVRQLGWCHKKP